MDANVAAVWATAVVSVVAVLSSVLNAALDRRHQLRSAELAWIRERRADVYLDLVTEIYTATVEEREPSWLFTPWPALEVFGSEKLIDELASLGDQWDNFDFGVDLNLLPPEEASRRADACNRAVGQRQAVIRLVNLELANSPANRIVRWKANRAVKRAIDETIQPV